MKMGLVQFSIVFSSYWPFLIGILQQRNGPVFMQLVHDDESVRRGISVSGVYVKLNGTFGLRRAKGKNGL